MTELARLHLRPTSRRGRAQESAPQQRRASAVDGRGVLGRWGLGPDGECAPCGRVRAVWRRFPVPRRPNRGCTPLERGRGQAPRLRNFAQLYRWRPLKNASEAPPQTDEPYRGRAQESAPQQRRASAVDGRGVLGRWGLGPDGECAPCGRVRAVWRRCPVPRRPNRGCTPLERGRGQAPPLRNFAQL